MIVTKHNKNTYRKKFEGRKAVDMERFITQYWNSVAAQDEEEIKQYFHEDAVVRWHNTNEQFTVAEFLRANCDYSGSWSGKVERIELIGNSVILLPMFGLKTCLFM